MKIELTLPALERLIGGDTEIEIAIRKQIAQAFADKHLKSVADQAIYDANNEAIKAHVNATIKEQLGVENIATSHLWPTIDYRLKSLIENLVKEGAQKIVDETLMKAIEYQKTYWSRELHKAVEKHINAEIERRIKEGVQARLNVAAGMGVE